MDILFRNGYYDILSEIFKYLSYLEIKNVCIVNKEISEYIKNKNRFITELINKKKEENIANTENVIKKLQMALKICWTFSGLLNMMIQQNESEMIDLLLEMDTLNVNELSLVIKRISNGYKIDKTLYRKNNVTFPIYADALLVAIDENKIEIIKKLVKDPRIDLNYKGGEILYSAIKTDNVEVVKLLLAETRVITKVGMRRSIRKAMEMGNTEILNLLFAYDKHEFYQGNEALIDAIRMGNVRIVQKLMNRPDINPAIRDNQAIISASFIGNLEIVNLLLADKRVNPCAKNNSAIGLASKQGHINVVHRLLEDPRVKNSLPKRDQVRYSTQQTLN